MPVLPVASFSVVLGLAGLANLWRTAHHVWGLPAVVGEALHALAAVVWVALVVLYAGKWVATPRDARAELEHPVQCCFVGLIGVAGMLVAGGALPYSRGAATALFVVAALFSLGFAVWRTGGLWQGGRDPQANTPILYLPTVAGSFVGATTASAFGHVEWARLFFGAGLFSWLAIESVLLHRLYTAPALAPPLRPTLGVQLAPPAVGGVAYLAITRGVPDLFAAALLGYGVLQALLLLRLAAWIRRQPFVLGYWAFTFAFSALATLALRMVERGAAGPAHSLAPILFVGTNGVTGAVAAATLGLLLRRPNAA